MSRAEQDSEQRMVEQLLTDRKCSRVIRVYCRDIVLFHEYEGGGRGRGGGGGGVVSCNDNNADGDTSRMNKLLNNI